MTARDLANQIRRNVEALRNNRQQELKIIGSDLAALIKLRIQGSGQDYLNQQFVPYRPWSIDERTALGYQVGYVDYTRTGRMWASVYPDVEGNGAKVTVVITAHGEDNIKKVKSAVFHKRGNILRPSQDELDLAAKANEARVRKYLAI